MKQFLLLITSLFSISLHSQVFTKKTQVVYDGHIYTIDVNINVPCNSENLNKTLAYEMFGYEGTLKDAVKHYLSQYTKDTSIPKIERIVPIKADEYYFNETTGLLCIRVFAPSKQLNSQLAIAPVRYVSYDVKKDKIVTMQDLIDMPLQNYIMGRGFDIEDLTTIQSFGHLFIARTTSGQEIRMTPFKLYKHMTDYGLALAGLDREKIEKGFAETNTDEVNKIYASVDDMPLFPGGVNALMQYLSRNIKYPAEAENAGIQGRVICSFVVEKDGSITDVKVAKGVDPLLDKEALRVIRTMPNWYPGYKDGTFVRVKFSMPVTFKLQ